jgi:hypothetical protein
VSGRMAVVAIPLQNERRVKDGFVTIVSPDDIDGDAQLPTGPDGLVSSTTSPENA